MTTRRHKRICAVWTVLFALLTIVVSIAPLAASEVDDPFTSADRDYWAFQPVTRPAVPECSAATASPIDAFLAARMDAKGVAPVGEADRRTLIRRATFDLLGLPPTPEQVAAFVADEDPLAYERLVDRLLASQRYGEHWARHWLDLVRYAESNGYKSDEIRPYAWRYRDYVIESLNDDKPYDRFVAEQLAGDELAPNDADALVATGFLCLWPYESNGRDVADQRQNILNDVTDVAGQVFLGLTVGCARCHDHKFDPILQKDYFRLQSFFAALSIGPDLPLAPTDVWTEHERKREAWEAATAELRDELAALEAPYYEKLRREKRTVFPDYVQEILDTESDGRSPGEQQLAAMTEMQLVVSPDEVQKRMSDEDRQQRETLMLALKECDKLRPTKLPLAMIARDIGATAPETSVVGTDEQVSPGYLSLLDPDPATVEQPDAETDTTGRRLALARWVTDAENPLTARVIVNRLWQQHFGRGLVATPNDFGLQGTPPTHPKLLDWLTSEFVAGGWRLKSLHRTIMLSAAYRRASVVNESDDAAAASEEHDPENELWWRAERRRLTAEQLRDAMLAASGELNLTMGGPSVKPELPTGISAAYAWKPTPDVAERNRRSIYMFVRRNLREPLLEAFDMPSSHESCPRRLETATAPQALALLNGNWSLDRARSLAGQVLAVGESDAETVVRDAFERVLLREPAEDEIAAALDFLVEQQAAIQERVENGEPIASPMPEGDGTDPARAAAVVDFCHVLLNCDEFVYLD